MRCKTEAGIIDRERASKIVSVLIERNGQFIRMPTMREQEHVGTCMLSNVDTEESGGEISLLLGMSVYVTLCVASENKRKRKKTDVNDYVWADHA